MTPSLSKEQRAIVDLPLSPLAVTACAGSGKTRTAVHRLLSMRQRYDGRGFIGLLSFSNVAVDTFRKQYATLLRSLQVIGQSSRVEIDTMDGFITTNVLRPHAHRLMKSPRVPFLVEGREGFLSSFTIYDGKRSLPTADIEAECQGNGFRYTIGRAKTALPTNWAEAALAKLGAVGAYSHSAGRYWALRVLRENPFVLRAMAQRYPHILVDEAQDIGPEHQAILELLIGAGSQVSLIGDPNQGIYEFARANGAFLKSYSARPDVSAHSLTINYRSLPGIVAVANHLTHQSDTADRSPPDDRPVAYYMSFKATERENTLASFRSLLSAANIDPAKGVVLCRSADWTAEWSGEMDGQGVGIVRCFADAALSRDRRKDFHKAFVQACVGLTGLLAAKHASLSSQLVRPPDEATRRMRRLIWSFVRDSSKGLPPSTLVADTEWHPLLRTRTEALLNKLISEFGLEASANLGQRLARKNLDSRPLLEIPDLATDLKAVFRTSTVHKVKGESLPAVLYIAKKPHVRALLDGATTEDGRIGYVALTRACDLLVLAVPEACLDDFEAELQAAGLTRVGLAGSSAVSA